MAFNITSASVATGLDNTTERSQGANKEIEIVEWPTGFSQPVYDFFIMSLDVRRDDGI